MLHFGTLTASVGTIAVSENSATDVTSVTATGDVTLVSTGLITLHGSVTSSGGAAVVTLQGAGVTELTGAIVQASQLLLLGTGTFTLTEANQVGTLAASITGPLSYTDVNDLTIGTVGGTSGITATGGSNTVTVTSGGLATGLTVAQSVSAGDDHADGHRYLDAGTELDGRRRGGHGDHHVGGRGRHG